MYGMFSVLFVIIVSFIYYEASTYYEGPFYYNEIQLAKYMTTQNHTIFGTCIDRSIMSQESFKQVKLKSHAQNTFAVLINHNPLLQCEQLSYAFDFTRSKTGKTQIQLDDIPQIKAIFGQYEIETLQKNAFLKIKNKQLFILVLSVQQAKISASKQIQTSNTVFLAVQNSKYLEPVLKPLLWFSWFNLIGISIIAYYRKNVFNNNLKLLSTISLLVYLMWIGFDSPSALEQVQQKIKLAMNCFILIICIKNHLTTCQTVFILGFSVLNQIALSYFEHKSDQNYSLMLWLTYALNFINASFITLGQNVEIVYFSMFAFVVQYGLVNQSVDIMHPFIFSLILVTLVFGPTIYELLQLKENFDMQSRKTKQRLQSYEVSQSDTLFRN